MSELKTNIRYDFNLLTQYCEKNGIKLTNDYSKEKVVIHTIIVGKCLKCEETSSKTFKAFMSTGCFCKIHTFQNGKEKSKATNLEKYGYECSFQNKKVQEKIKATNLEKYGCENPLQNKEIKEKSKATNLEKYGCDHPLQNKDVQEKSKATNLEKYGYEYPSQNAEVSAKSSKNAYKSYNYTFPSGRVERIQGYEKYMLNDLLQKENISEDDIIVDRSDVPSVWYEDTKGKKHRYFVDCFIKSQNRCIEAKSTWTAEKKQDCIYLKQQSLKDAGYLCEIWIYDSKGQIINKF